MSQQKLMELPDPVIGDIEDRLRQRGVNTVIGVDEAGRGPLAGPVVAAAFVLDLNQPLAEQLDELDDSKKLDANQRDQLFEGLTAGDFRYATAASDAGMIDEINVLQATFRAMKQAVEEVFEKLETPPDTVLIDGNMTIPDGPDNQRAVVSGDARSQAIAAASVIAKVTRDRQMIEAHSRWPDYGFDSHKGYGTAQHRQAIADHGPCPLHRRSFAGVVTDETTD